MIVTFSESSFYLQLSCQSGRFNTSLTFLTYYQGLVTVENVLTSTMPVALEPTRNIQMIRDKTFYGFKPDGAAAHLKTKKSVPWVDVSDDDERGKQGSMKRKLSVLHGHSNRHQHAQNGHKHKKHRGNNDVEIQTNGDINGAGPSHTKHIQNDAADHGSQHHAKAKAIQEQRTQLPIAKGTVRLPCKS